MFSSKMDDDEQDWVQEAEALGIDLTDQSLRETEIKDQIQLHVLAYLTCLVVAFGATSSDPSYSDLQFFFDIVALCNIFPAPGRVLETLVLESPIVPPTAC